MPNAGATFQIVGIAGSLRRDSYNRRLLATAGELVPAGVSLTIADLTPIPFYNGDVEAAGDPPKVRAFKEQIRAADALLIATPEYNGTVPGVLQNAIDWASRPRGDAALTDMPVAVIGASPSPRGTARAQAILRRVLTITGARVMAEPELLVPHAVDRFDDGGVLTDEQLRQDLAALLVALTRWAEVVKDHDSAAA